ncbi:AP2 domain transcription factor [Medicago truncatula]|uniref:AP2 domain transcription factor n=1 Tax=Medicago truncatula TaxID=3880 RepID=G7KYV0_MEDTR|nr:AP2 domain transcription factor [Medicago truncatula]
MAMLIENEVMCLGKSQRSMDGKEVKGARRVKRQRRDAIVPKIGDDANKMAQKQVGENSTTNTSKRSSRFRGVSRHRWTGRFEAHLWDKLSWNTTQKKKGKQGAYDEEESAARAYDLAALKYWGTSTFTNFPISDYDKEIEIMNTMTKEEYLATLRRKSSGFSRGVSKYRGVARHHHNGRWEARIGRVFGNKYLYLGTYSTQEEAARAYDIAAIEYRGIHAVTNFELSSYIKWLKPETTTEENHESQILQKESRTLAPPNNSTLLQESKLLALQKSFFIPNDLNSTEKQESSFENKNYHFLSNKSTSPTALSLLLRSSLFRELLEKNSNVSEDEVTKEQQQQQITSDDELGGIFYDGIDNISFDFDPNSCNIELQERDLHSISCLYQYLNFGQ